MAGPYTRDELGVLSAYAKLHWLREMTSQELEGVLPEVDCLFVHSWPPELGPEKVRMMRNLSFVQSGLAGVNHIPFGEIGKGVIICSNAGGYSDEVGEFAWALILAASKGIVRSHRRAKEAGYGSAPLELGKKIVVLRGKVLGILGYGGIGNSVAKVGRSLGMKVVVLTRNGGDEEGITTVSGADGLKTIVTESDVIVLALPLTNSTRGMMGRNEFSLMKKNAILVNVARAEIVDGRAIYEHLSANKDFVYATDVWWMKDGKEAYPPDLPFFDLENFVGTPHIAGPSAVVGGGPMRNAVENLLRFLKGEKVKNVVDRSDYTN